MLPGRLDIDAHLRMRVVEEMRVTQDVGSALPVAGKIDILETRRPQAVDQLFGIPPGYVVADVVRLETAKAGEEVERADLSLFRDNTPDLAGVEFYRGGAAIIRGELAGDVMQPAFFDRACVRRLPVNVPIVSVEPGASVIVAVEPTCITALKGGEIQISIGAGSDAEDASGLKRVKGVAKQSLHGGVCDVLDRMAGVNNLSRGILNWEPAPGHQVIGDEASLYASIPITRVIKVGPAGMEERAGAHVVKSPITNGICRVKPRIISSIVGPHARHGNPGFGKASFGKLHRFWSQAGGRPAGCRRLSWNGRSEGGRSHNGSIAQSELAGKS